MPERLTRRQAAIIGAYTGILCGPFSDLQEYAEEVLDYKGISTIGMLALADNLKEKSREDFLAICFKENG